MDHDDERKWMLWQGRKHRRREGREDAHHIVLLHNPLHLLVTPLLQDALGTRETVHPFRFDVGVLRVCDDLGDGGSIVLGSSRDGVAGGEGFPEEHEGVSGAREFASHFLKQGEGSGIGPEEERQRRSGSVKGG
jgi:hypothetical protein